MALKIDDALLVELGLGGLPAADKRGLLQHIYETLEMRVGMRLADQMSNEQLDEFEKFVNTNDDQGAFRWLETNFPNYKDIVNDEFEKLKLEIRRSVPQILASSQPSAPPPPDAVPQPPSDSPYGYGDGDVPPQQPYQGPQMQPPYPYQQPPASPPQQQ